MTRPQYQVVSKRRVTGRMISAVRVWYNPDMKTIVMIVLLLSGLGHAFAADRSPMNWFQAGIFGDDARVVTCVSGPPGSTSEQVVWVWVPDELGLAYVTLRFAFPENLDLSSRPVFHDLVTNVILTDYVDGTVEWNMLFDECPSGWVKIFSQEFVLLDDLPSRIEIHGVDSMVRDCTFVLNDVTVLNELTVNDPGCPPVSTANMIWSSLKSMYR